MKLDFTYFHFPKQPQRMKRLQILAHRLLSPAQKAVGMEIASSRTRLKAREVEKGNRKVLKVPTSCRNSFLDVTTLVQIHMDPDFASTTRWVVALRRPMVLNAAEVGICVAERIATLRTQRRTMMQRKSDSSAASAIWSKLVRICSNAWSLKCSLGPPGSLPVGGSLAWCRLLGRIMSKANVQWLWWSWLILQRSQALSC